MYCLEQNFFSLALRRSQEKSMSHLGNGNNLKYIETYFEQFIYYTRAPSVSADAKAKLLAEGTGTLN